MEYLLSDNDSASSHGVETIGQRSEPGFPSLTWLILWIIALYRGSFLHKWTHRNGCRCCFLPTCTEYCARAVVKYGPWRGLRLAAGRFRRCRADYQGPFVDFP